MPSWQERLDGERALREMKADGINNDPAFNPVKAEFGSGLLWFRRAKGSPRNQQLWLSPKSGPFRKIRLGWRALRSRAFRFLVGLNRRAHTIWYETRSLPCRIRQSESMRRAGGLPLGSSLGQDSLGNLTLGKAANARIRDIQSLEQANRWVTITDCWLFLQGWEKGREWAVRGGGNSDSGNELLRSHAEASEEHYHADSAEARSLASSKATTSEASHT